MTAVVLLTGMVTGTAAAVVVGSGTLGGFESDGNFESNGSLDWATVAPVVATDDTADSGFQGSSKEEEPADWTCNTGGASPGKGNILKAYISPRIEQSSAFLDIGYVRQDGNGDAHVNFEFNKMPAAPGSNSGACPIIRTTDDFLVTYDFAGGNAPAEIRVWRWNGSNWIELMIGANDAKGATNGAAVTDPDGNTIQVREFGEGTIDLLSIAIPQGFIGCPGFGYANIRSRSSHSITSALQDRLPTTPVDLNTCGKIVVHKVDDRLPSGLPLAGATFGLFSNPGATGTPMKTATSGADGKATFNDVVPGTYYVKELSAPANHTPDNDVVGPINVGFRQTADVGAPFVNPIVRLAKIKIDPAQDANQVGDDHPLTVTVTKKGASGSDLRACCEHPRHAVQGVGAGLVQERCRHVHDERERCVLRDARLVDGRSDDRLGERGRSRGHQDRRGLDQQPERQLRPGPQAVGRRTADR